MLIPIPVPISTRHVAAAAGTVWKSVTCECCGSKYAYLLELTATGEDHDLFHLDRQGSMKPAQAKAQENLERKGRNLVVPVPCPGCGFYQQEMSRHLKEEAWTNP